MKKRLFIVNTLYQLMTVINLQYTLFRGDLADVFLSDCSVGAEEICRSTAGAGLFHQVYFIRTKQFLETKSLADKARRFADYFFFGGAAFEKIVPDIEYTYDELLFYNYDSLAMYLFKRIEKNNPSAVWSRFEEGYISYFTGGVDSRIVKWSETIKHLLGRRGDMESRCDSYYFYEPAFVLFHGPYHVKRIPKIDRKDETLKAILNRCFLAGNITEEYRKKYIFFEESFFINGDGIHDEEVIDAIGEAVGKENLLVKLHPRNPTNRFAGRGITVNRTVGIPWEVVHLNGNFEKNIFIAISCGSVIAGKILYGDPVKTFLLYRCVNKRPPLVDDKYECYIEKIIKKYGDDFIVPESLEEAVMLLKQERKNALSEKEKKGGTG